MYWGDLVCMLPVYKCYCQKIVIRYIIMSNTARDDPLFVY